MNDLDFVKKLEGNDWLFDREYGRLGEFYNVRHYEKIHDYLSKHKGLIVLLNKLKPRLSEDFPSGKFDLVHYTDYDRLNDCNDFFKNNSDKIVDTTNDAFDSLNVLMNNPPYNF